MKYIRSLKYSAPGIAAAVFAIVLVAAVVYSHRFSPTQPSHLASAIVHSLHGPGFFVVAILIYIATGILKVGGNRYIIAAVLSMGIAVIAEGAQIPGPRDAEVKDLVVDFVGIVAGLGLIAFFDRDVRRKLGMRKWAVFGTTVSVFLAVALLPTVWLAYAWFAQLRAAPELLTFEERWERAMIINIDGQRPERLPIPDEWPVLGDHVASTQASGRYGTLVRFMPFPDWSSFSRICFAAAAQTPVPANVVLSVRDMRIDGERRGGRGTWRLELDSSPTRYCVPLKSIAASAPERPLNMARVESVQLSMADRKQAATILLDDFRLE